MKKATNLLYLLALVKIILPYLLQNPVYEPHRDEFLYLAEGNHPAWGFMEVPPLLSVFAWLTQHLGGGMFWIKLWPSLFGAFLYIIIGRMVISFGGRSFAVFLAFLPFLFSAYLRVFFLFQPNFLEIFFWTLIVVSIVKHIQTGSNGWLYVFGVSTGLGMLSKYSVSFIIVSVCIGLLLTRQRKIFLNKHFWIAAATGFVIFLPNLVWQYNNKFPVVYHMKELRETQLQYVSPVGFLTDQLVMHLPVFFIWIAGLLFVSFKEEGKQFRFIGWAYVSVIVLLLLGNGKNYYSLGVYPPLFAFGALYLEKLTRVNRRAWRYVFAAIPLVFGTLFLPLALPVLPPSQLAELLKKIHAENTGALKWEDLQNHPLPQDFSDMLGWKEMARKTAKAYNSLTPEEKKNSIIFCDNYGMAGAVNYYGKQYKLPECYSDNASFLYWIPDSLALKNIVLVTGDQEEMSHDFVKDFQSAVITDTVKTEYAREKGDLIIVFKNGNDKFIKMFGDKIQRDKDEMHY